MHTFALLRVKILVSWARDVLALALACFQVEEVTGVAAAYNASIQAT